MLQGVAADCNSAEATQAWFDSRIAHHLQTGINDLMVAEMNSRMAYFAEHGAARLMGCAIERARSSPPTICRIYSEKLVPQPQLAVAFGFSTTNLAPINSSVKSITALARKGKET